MSRCGEWNGTYNHVANYLIEKKGVSDRKAFNITKKLIYEYTKNNKYNGSFSDKVMYVRKNFSGFMNFLNENLEN